jgi:hypothetical protein
MGTDIGTAVKPLINKESYRACADRTDKTLLLFAHLIILDFVPVWERVYMRVTIIGNIGAMGSSVLFTES